jgi:hypothetical protein
MKAAVTKKSVSVLPLHGIAAAFLKVIFQHQHQGLARCNFTRQAQPHISHKDSLDSRQRQPSR